MESKLVKSEEGRGSSKVPSSSSAAKTLTTTTSPPSSSSTSATASTSTSSTGTPAVASTSASVDIYEEILNDDLLDTKSKVKKLGQLRKMFPDHFRQRFGIKPDLEKLVQTYETEKAPAFNMVGSLVASTQLYSPCSAKIISEALTKIELKKLCVKLASDSCPGLSSLECKDKYEKMKVFHGQVSTELENQRALKKEKAAFYKQFGGVTIESITKNLGHIPPILHDACEYLAVNTKVMQTQGIFRMSALDEHVKDVVTKANRGEKIDFTKYGPHVAPAVIKKFMRELKNPIIPYTLYAKILNFHGCKVDDKKKVASSIVQELPASNLKVLQKVWEILVEVIKNETKNLMTPGNLAIVLSPNLCWPENKIQSPAEFQDIGKFIEFLLIHHELVIPGISVQ